MDEVPAPPVPDPAREFPELEIESCIASYGGWLGWMGNHPSYAVAALAWMGSQGDQLPEELHSLDRALQAFAPAKEKYENLWTVLRDVLENERTHYDKGGAGHIALSDVLTRMDDLEQILSEPPHKNPVPEPPLKVT